MHIIIVIKSDHCWHAAKVNHVENTSLRKGIIVANYHYCLSVTNVQSVQPFISQFSFKLTCRSKSSTDCNVTTRNREVFLFSNDHILKYLDPRENC